MDFVASSLTLKASQIELKIGSLKWTPIALSNQIIKILHLAEMILIGN